MFSSIMRKFFGIISRRVARSRFTLIVKSHFIRYSTVTAQDLLKLVFEQFTGDRIG